MKIDNMKRVAAFTAAIMVLAMTGCSSSISNDEGAASSSADSVVAVTTIEATIEADDIEVGYEESEAIAITFSDDGVSAEGSSVSTDGTTVTITAEGTYLLSGSCKDGRIIVEADKKDKVKLVLKGLDLTCGDNAPLLVRSAKKVYLMLDDGSENTFTDGESYAVAEDENTDAAIFAKSDLTINGEGTLTVSANYKHGILSKDDLVITGGNVKVTSASSALVGKDSVKISAGSLDLTSGTDAVKTTNTEDEGKGFISVSGGSFVINAGGDGIYASTDLQISGGEFDITTGGGSANASMKSNGMPNDNWQNDFGMGGKPGGMGGRFDSDDIGMGDMDFGNFGNKGGFDRGDMGTPPDMPKGDMGEFDRGNMGGGTPPDMPAEGMSPVAAQSGLEIEFAVATADDEIFKQAFGNGEAAVVGVSSEGSSSSAKGLKAGGNIIIEDGTFSIDSADDSLHCDGSVYISGGNITAASGDDGIHADSDLVIDGGTINITKSYEGIEGMTVTISGGDIKVVAKDDGINCAGGSDTGSDNRMGRDQFAAQEGVYLRISGGSVNVDAGGDGLDSNGDIYIDGGVIYVSGPENGGNGSIDHNGIASITGGTVVASGAVGMEEMFDESGTTQCAVLHDFSQSFSAGTDFTVTDASGKVILSFTNEKTWQGVIFSSPDLKEGESYTVSAGGESETISIDGMITSNGIGVGFGGGFGGGKRGNKGF